MKVMAERRNLKRTFASLSPAVWDPSPFRSFLSRFMSTCVPVTGSAFAVWLVVSMLAER
jgi:hypothetical protein